MAKEANRPEDQRPVDLVKPNDTFIPITQTGKQVGKGTGLFNANVIG